MFIEMFPAQDGDAFLIRLDNKKNILIDMGYIDTYKKHIKPKMMDLKNENQCIDLLIITHIDKDHIEGAIDFFKDNGNAYNPNIIEIREIWHNSYRHLQFDKEKVCNISTFEKKKLEEIKLSNSIVTKKETNESIPVSATHGSTLAGYLYGLGYEERWNTSFDFAAVNLDGRNEIILGDIKFYILSPNTKKLDGLSKLWLQKLVKIDINFSLSDEVIFDDAYEMFLKNEKIIYSDESKDVSSSPKGLKAIIDSEIKQKNKDGSKSNGASIAFILEYKGKKLLFLADSHEDIILDNLGKYNERERSLEFDAIKISHHGSLKNNFEWIEKLKSKRYLISTNGEHYHHPEQEVLAKILQFNNENKMFYFNYQTDTSKALDDTGLKEKYKYSVITGDGKNSLEIEVKINDE